jgi:hypothetical protein
MAHVMKLSVADKALLTASIACAFLPFGIFVMMVSFNLPLLGNVFFNPVTISAYLWLMLTIGYYRRTRSKLAKWLFVLFPVAFVFRYCLVFLRYGVISG